MQAGESFRLVVRRGPQPNQVYELRDDVINLGRDITNAITINDREVSRHHLRFTRSGDTYMVEDLGSTNGTFINGKRLTGSALLKNGDMIGLGETVTLGFEVVRPGTANPYQAPPSAAASPYQPPQAAPVPPAAPASPYQPPAASPFQSPQAAPVPPSAQPVQLVNPYQPPSVSPKPQTPYQTPGVPSYPPPPGADPYAPPIYGPPDPYAQGYPDPQYAAYYGQPVGYGAPPPPGYDYDPYAMREQSSSPLRPVLIGCAGLMVFCCVLTVGVFVLIDTLNLYCQVPVLNSVLQALGMIRCPVGG